MEVMPGLYPILFLLWVLFTGLRIRHPSKVTGVLVTSWGAQRAHFTYIVFRQLGQRTAKLLG